MPIKRGLQFALMLLLFNRHPKDVCGALQKSYIVLAKLAFGFAVNFQYAERHTVALENNVHRPMNTVLQK